MVNAYFNKHFVDFPDFVLFDFTFKEFSDRKYGITRMSLKGILLCNWSSLGNSAFELSLLNLQIMQFSIYSTMCMEYVTVNKIEHVKRNPMPTTLVSLIQRTLNALLIGKQLKQEIYNQKKKQ